MVFNGADIGPIIYGTNFEHKAFLGFWMRGGQNNFGWKLHGFQP